MKYITRVKIQNFQNHKDTDIELGSGVNLIVGSSEQGKSAVLRAINWVLHNLPRSSKFVRRGTDETKVTLWFSDGTIVTRIKGTKRNAVEVTKPDGTELVFDKIGIELPVDAIEAMGNPPMDERHGPISYAKQLDPLFLTSLSTTDLPRSISELTGIDDFEEAVSILSKQSTASKKTTKEIQERIDGYDVGLEKYVNLDKQLNELELLTKDSNIIKKNIASLNDIDGLLSKYQVVFTTGRTTSRKLKQSKAILNFENDLKVTNEKKNTILEINKLIANNEQSKEKEQNLITKIKCCDILQDKNIVDGVEKAKTIKNNIKSIEAVVLEHTSVLSKGNGIKKNYDKWFSTYNELTAEHAELIDYMKENGIWCDNCNRPLTQIHDCENEND